MTLWFQVLKYTQGKQKSKPTKLATSLNTHT